MSLIAPTDCHPLLGLHADLPAPTRTAAPLELGGRSEMKAGVGAPLAVPDLTVDCLPD